ncbi:MAG: energy transducer TonB, partial [Burkholderiaceae bacterium]
MSASASVSFPSEATPMQWSALKRLGPLTAVILLHVGFFHALQSGLLQPPAPMAAREVLVHFITPTPAPTPLPTPKVEAPPPPKPPKTVPLAKKPPVPTPKPRPTVQPVNPEPSEQAITL